MTGWVTAPPSDHDEKLYVAPEIVCGVGALIVFVEPMMTVFTNGAVRLSLLSASLAPASANWVAASVEASLSPTVWGSSLRLFVAERPLESVAVSCSSSHEGYPWSGAPIVALATPWKVWIRCVWQFDDEKQWWRISVQSSLDGARVPSSASVALPEKEMAWPTRQWSDEVGDVIVGVGGVFPGVSAIGEEIVETPWLSVTSSVAVIVPAVEYVRVGLTAVESSYAPSPSRSQAYVIGSPSGSLEPPPSK